MTLAQWVAATPYLQPLCAQACWVLVPVLLVCQLWLPEA